MMNPLKISTARLDLTAATLEHVCAELQAPDELAALLDATIEPGWPPGEYDRGAQEFFRDRYQEEGQPAVGWYIWYAVRRGGSQQSAVLMGAGGYFGPPNSNGEVEIGFSVMNAWRNQGYATEMVQALIKHAFTNPCVNKMVAHTVPGNLASRKVLTKSGFQYAGPGEEPETIRFELFCSARSV